MKYLNLLVLATSLSTMLLGTGCNLTGGLDTAKSNEEVYLNAQSKMDQGDCDGAVNALINVGIKDDRIYRLLGWAKLCQAGAPFSKVASVLTYNSANSTDFTAVGALATKLIPMTDAKISILTEAVTYFSQVTGNENANDKAINLTLANITKAAAIIATTTSDGASVRRADVSVAACVGSTCNASNTACTAASNGKLTNADSNAVGTALSAASTAAGGNDQLGAAKDLANRLGLNVSTSVAAFTRCTIVNQMLSQ